MDPVADLLSYIDASPTPYHAVAESARRLQSAGYARLEESETWQLSVGERGYCVRGDGSLVAFEIGGEAPGDAGFRIVGAHTDSPNLRLKPVCDVSAHGYRQWAVETYGGLLLHTWLDRDLSLAGRVSLETDAGPRVELVDFPGAGLRVPSLAIHLNREIRSEGLKLAPQRHAAPLAGLDGLPALQDLLARELRARGVAGAAPERILAFDLMLYDPQPASRLGLDGSFVSAPRLDNLASCHAAVSALAGCAGRGAEFTRAIVLYDHEEVGSRSATGAAGTFLLDTLERCVAGFKGGEAQGLARARARSMLISADMAHAVHPGYAEKHDPGHRPVIGGGPVIKTNHDQAYASDARTAGVFASLCARAGVEPQHFSSRNDLPCGSTIGPISAARVGIPTVDVGNPMLSMHSCRELAGAADVAPMIEVLRGFLGG